MQLRIRSSDVSAPGVNDILLDALDAPMAGPDASGKNLPNEPPLVIEGARIYPAPHEPCIENGSLLIQDGRVAALGEDVPVPAGARVIPGKGRAVTAGFWNAHVHFTEPKWRSVARASSAEVDANLADMLTSHGFTTVVDTGSDPRVTFRLRERIESGEVRGPRVYTSGPGMYPPRGIPYYLRGTIPFWLAPFVPQPRSAGAARRGVSRNIARGADLIKLFTGSYVARGTVKTMPLEIARAAVSEAHAHGRLVYSHASNFAGTRIATEAGVDVLAHPPDSAGGIDDAVLRSMVDRRMSMTPTLKMFADTASSSPTYLAPIYEVVRRFRELGGGLLFGTDVGYLTDYGTVDEYRALSRCGLDPPSILRMLTTAPAARFGVAATAGEVRLGRPADLVVLDGDPMADVDAFSRVRATIRQGRVVFLLP